MRKTKILITLGPSSESKKIIEKMIDSGLNAVRCNFSHGQSKDHLKRIKLVRRTARKKDKRIGIMVDLQGPKIRISKFKKKIVTLKKNENFILDANMEENSGNEEIVGIDYKELPKCVEKNDILFLDDGKIVLVVKKIIEKKIHCKIKTGGILSNNKGINKKGGRLTAPALTNKDKKDIKIAASYKVDYVAVSFPKNEKDINYTRKLLQKEKCDANIIAKIERNEAIENIEKIISVSDGLMVARGDLAIEIGDENVPAIQKMIIRSARKMDKIVITATQMMESMISNSIPTRAEVSDVANAVMDGTDVVMLSAESASGKYPLETLKKMSSICEAAENSNLIDIISKEKFIINNHKQVNEAVATAAVYLANKINASAIISFTESGSTPRWMSRINSQIQIYGFSKKPLTLGIMTLYKGVIPIKFDSTIKFSNIYKKACLELEKRNIINYKDWIIISSGDQMGIQGKTNKIKIVQAGNII